MGKLKDEAQQHLRAVAAFRTKAGQTNQQSDHPRLPSKVQIQKSSHLQPRKP